VVAVGTLLTACATRPPASLDGLKKVFHDPGFAVQGKTRQDQVWISSTQEIGIRVLGWARPKGVAGKKVVLAKTRRTVPAHVAKPAAAKRPQPGGGHILLPTPRTQPLPPRVESPTNEDETGVGTVAPPAAPLRPAHNPTMSERLREEIRVLNERIRKLEGK
jgi:hypothetical protein